ncbi:2TM domain-containing protein [Cytophagaceae bacterium ABcell3]|nr:2TM domain-containing protein [Cytophagaceae bacterium ABcell3]
MTQHISLEEYKKAYREVVAKEEKKDFRYHMIWYICINVLLVIVNLTLTPGNLWFYWPLLGWGIGIASHYYQVNTLDKYLKKKEKYAEEKAMAGKK